MRSVSLGLCVLAFLNCFIIGQNTPITRGDLNDDGVLNIQDAAILADHLIGNLDELSKSGDLNGDDRTDVVDEVLLLNCIAGNMELPWLAGDLYQTDSIVGNLMYVPAGTFVQGSPTDDGCRNLFEAQFTHTLSRSLAVMATEVTRQMWADLKAQQPTLPADPTETGHGAGMTNPVQTVTWYEAVLFANLLSVQRGLTRCYYTDGDFDTPIDASNYAAGSNAFDFDADGYRLLTEGEWEYCCRAGTATPFWIAEPNYNGGNCYSCTSGRLPNLESAAVFCANDPNGTAAVATKLPNPWGLYDTHGNVWEWCWDMIGNYPAGSATDWAGPDSTFYRVIRGGGWIDFDSYCRSAHRESLSPVEHSNSLGFRLVRTIP